MGPAPQRLTATPDAIAPHRPLCQARGMFTIEHEFDATTVTLIDEGDDGMPLQGDVVIRGFEECVTVEQIDPITGLSMQVTLSMAQIADLSAALNLPEGAYRIERRSQSESGDLQS